MSYPKYKDIIRTPRYIGEVDHCEESGNGLLRVYFRWAHCITEGSEGCFYNDYLELLPENIKILN